MLTSSESWIPDPILTREIEAQFESALAAYRAKPTLITEHANHEESIRTGGYATRTLLELVQNASDAMAGASDDDLGRVEIIFNPDTATLYCANSGRPFSKSGIIAITHAHLSGKRGDEIGRFGLGFKSVLAVSENPQVFSRSASFEFNSPKAQSALASIGAPTRRLPILRTATGLDASREIEGDAILAGLASWATTIVRLPNVSGHDHLRREMATFASEFLLFVTAVREIRLTILGDNGMTTSHESRPLGDGRYKIQRPDGQGDEWFVSERMHHPSAEARHEVGEAVSREALKVSVAIPRRPRRANNETGDQGTQTGQFWAYFPLQDRTSATGFFNAPWSMNDDRTTLLRNRYNREILDEVADMFVGLLPRLSSANDPAALLDFLPARGREADQFGDEILCAIIPRLAATHAIIPDARGKLRKPHELRPLDFLCDWRIVERAHEAWIASPNTGDDVPHWRCYSSTQRMTRLRDLFVAGSDTSRFEWDKRDQKRALEQLSTRGILSWLLEWADGDHSESAHNALRVVMDNLGTPDASSARVIPTTRGMRAINDRSTVFLLQQDELTVDGAAFVNVDFLTYPSVEGDLRRLGFRDLDPIAIFTARLSQLTNDADHSLQEKFWDAALDVTVTQATKVIAEHTAAHILVPTRDGGWNWPQKVLDVDVPESADNRFLLLDTTRCQSGLAHSLGVASAPIAEFSYEDEIRWLEYESWVKSELNSALPTGERRIESISLYPRSPQTPGPFSALFILSEADASKDVLAAWTHRLLEHGATDWDCEDSLSGQTHRVTSPVRWAAERAGALHTSDGIRPVPEVVAPSLVKFEGLLPLFKGDRRISEALGLPSTIDGLSPAVLQRALSNPYIDPRVKDENLVDFIVQATAIAYPEGAPIRLPARAGRIIEQFQTSSIFVATNEEQFAYLTDRQLPCLKTDEATAKYLKQRTGCRLYDDGFSSSIRAEGKREPEKLLDVFPGLREQIGHPNLRSATITRTDSITKWVTTAEGMEPESLDFFLDGFDLIVPSSFEDNQTLRLVSNAFDLALTNAEIDNALRVGVDHKLALLRASASSMSTDAEKLEVYFGEDDLREKLPKGLWHGLEKQGLVQSTTSVAQLYLNVFENDTIKELADLFRQTGFPDVPERWAGGSATISWLRGMGFGPEFAGQPAPHEEAEFTVPGASLLPPLHDFQQKLSRNLRERILSPDASGRPAKLMVDLPTGAGKTRVASQTILQAFIDGKLRGPVLWIAQSQELCEQAVQTFAQVWRGLCTDQRIDLPLMIGRLWEGKQIRQPDLDLSVIIATDAKLDVCRKSPEYDWLANASVVIIDEGHRAGESPRYTRILSWLGVDGRRWERPLVGLSATPFKGTSTEATQSLIARFGGTKIEAFEDGTAYSDLVDLGILAAARHHILDGATVPLEPDEATEARERKRVSHRVMTKIGKDVARMQTLVNHILSLEERWRKSVLVFMPDVLSAQVLAATLKFHDITAASVSGQSSRQKRRENIQKFKDGEISVLTNCDLLIQGFDAPGVTALYIARPTFSPNAYIQMAGRGLRGPLNGGKQECLIVDLKDNFVAADINDLLGFREYEYLWRADAR